MGRDSYYEILGLSHTATSEEIKARYRKLLLRIHPDVDGPVALFRQVQQAYEVLSDPGRRATYDRALAAGSGIARPHGIHEGPSFAETWPKDGRTDPDRGNGAASMHRSVTRQSARSTRGALNSSFGRHPAGPLALVGLILLGLGMASSQLDIALISLGVASLFIAGVSGLGARGAKERAAYQRSGMTAVDAMTGRQFEVFLENFFANKGYRVARIGGRRGKPGSGLLLNGAHGRIIVHTRRRSDVVSLDDVQVAIAAKQHYSASRAMVVTSSDYSDDAVSVAITNGVTLWNRAALAAELTSVRGVPPLPAVRRLSSELQAGSRIFLGFVTVLVVVLTTTRAKTRGLAPVKGHRQ